MTNPAVGVRLSACRGMGRAGTMESMPRDSSIVTKKGHSLAMMIIRGLWPFLCSISQKEMQALCSLHSAGLQTRSTNVHLSGSAVYLNLYRFYVGLPHSVGSSMGMAYVISEMSGFFTDCALCHDCTSLTIILYIYSYIDSQQ